MAEYDPKFRNASGSRYLNALFFEHYLDKETVLYTLKSKDHNGYPSLYRLYMELADPLEYTFANTYFEDWDHWKTLTECNWFKPYITKWRKELELKIRSEALVRLRQDAEGDSKTSVSSNKYLLEGGWKDKAEKGRPSKDDIRKAAKEEVSVSNQINEDFLRISSIDGLRAN